MIILHWDQNLSAENSLEFNSLFVLWSPYRFACVCTCMCIYITKIAREGSTRGDFIFNCSSLCYEYTLNISHKLFLILILSLTFDF